MNYLTIPRNNVSEPDKDMTDDRLEVAVQFTGELVTLGDLRLPSTAECVKAPSVALSSSTSESASSSASPCAGPSCSRARDSARGRMSR
jgi:hypothetical protein